MNKKQKIWPGIFIILFAVPEILWSPIGNFLYALYAPLDKGSARILRNNFLVEPQHLDWLSIVLGVQLLGILLLVIYLIIIRNTFRQKRLWWLGIFFLAMITLVVAMLFSLSFTLRSIG